MCCRETDEGVYAGERHCGRRERESRIVKEGEIRKGEGIKGERGKGRKREERIGERERD